MTTEFDDRRRCGVLGSPISHSLSPALHRAAYRYLGLNWSYTAHEVRADELAAFVAMLDHSWRGLSLTMPLKRVALSVAGRVGELAELVGAANTLVREEDGTWWADNTDVPGMVTAIRQYRTGHVWSACLWGGGATAASAVAAMAQLAATDVHLHARDAGRAAGPLAVAERAGLTIGVHPWQVVPGCAAADVVISTVPAGAADSVAEQLAEAAAPHRLLFDVVYDPWPTALAAAWQKSGGTVVSGLDLLVHQAQGQVRLTTGRDVPPRVLYAAVQ